ncbi:hypothetical protein Tco_0710095 [Tanacetum coccineum]
MNRDFLYPLAPSLDSIMLSYPESPPIYTSYIETDLEHSVPTQSNEVKQIMLLLIAWAFVDRGTIKVLALESIKDAQAEEISALKSIIKKLEKKYKPSISHHRAWLKCVNRLSIKKRFIKEFYMETKEAVDEGRQCGETEEVNLTDDTEVVEDKGSGDKGGNAEKLVSTARLEVSTARPDIDAARQEDSVVEPRTPPKITNPARSILTLKATSNKDPKYKGWYMRKNLEEMERKEMKDRDIIKASMDYIASLYDEVQAKMDASEELVARLQMEEREMYTIEERSKLLAEFFERRKKLLVEERAVVALYIKEQESVADFVPIGSERDERMIDKMNKKAAGMVEDEVLEEPDSTKVEVKQEGREENIRKRSGRRLKMKATKKSKRQKIDSDLEKRKKKWIIKSLDLSIKTVEYHILHVEDGTEIPHALQKEGIHLRETLERMMELRLTGQNQKRSNDDIWKNQEKWIIKSWTFYENCGVHILALEDGTKIQLLEERRYPLIRETLERMMELRLTAESEGEAVFNLLRFIQKQIDEFEGQDRSEKDL